MEDRPITYDDDSNGSQDKPRRRGLDDLPVEILAIILSHSSTVQVLQSLSRCSPVFYNIYLDNKLALFEQILYRDTGSGSCILIDTILCARVSAIPPKEVCTIECNNIKSLRGFDQLKSSSNRKIKTCQLLNQYRVKRAVEKVPGQSFCSGGIAVIVDLYGDFRKRQLRKPDFDTWQLPIDQSLSQLIRLRTIIDLLVEDCSRYLFENITVLLKPGETTENGRTPNLSFTETCRLYRAFYRFETFCQLCYKGWLDTEALHLWYLSNFESWEIEEFMVVYNYLLIKWHDIYRESSQGQGKSQLVITDIQCHHHQGYETYIGLSMWSESSLQDLQYYTDGSIMHGLEYFWETSKCLSVDERIARVQSHWPYHGAFNFLSHHCLYNLEELRQQVSALTAFHDKNEDGDTEDGDTEDEDTEDGNQDVNSYNWLRNNGAFPIDTEIYSNITAEFTGDHPDHPNAAWPWQVEHHIFIIPRYWKDYQLYKYGLVMWDKQRLDKWGVMQEDPEKFL